MTFEEAHALAVSELDAAYESLRRIHLNPEYLNSEHETYVRCTNRFVAATERLFRLKAVWHEMNRLGGK